MSKQKAKVISINSKKTDKVRPKKPGKTPSKIYQIKVSLCETDPSIWRRLLIAGDTNLGLLHGILQISMGWQNSHLHQFMVEEAFYADPEAELEDVRNELNTTISKIAPAEKDNFMYMYDFGDSWDHVIQVEKILPEHKDFALPATCIGGEGACPPEDCGGIPGYYDFCEIMQSPDNDGYDEMYDWFGRQYDPEQFDAGEVNKYLKQLKWKKPNWMQLGNVLAERDGVEFDEF
jgi:hypothetical protein